MKPLDTMNIAGKPFKRVHQEHQNPVTKLKAPSNVPPTKNPTVEAKNMLRRGMEGKKK